MNSDLLKQNQLSRRTFVRSCAAGAATLATGSLWGLAPAGKGSRTGPAQLLFALDQDWLFGGKVDPDAKGTHVDESAFTKITLPHCVTKLSWQEWDAASWQDVWLYRRRFSVPKEFANRRVFVKFEGVMVSSEASINGTPLPAHQGGYLPFTYELTPSLKASGNVLDLKVDARFQNVPPEGSPRGPHAVDYYLPGGIIRGVSLYAVPQIFLNDVFAKPVDVLKPTRRVEIACSIDAAVAAHGPVHLEVKLMDGTKVISSVKKEVTIAQAGKTDVALTLAGLGDAKLWDVDAPHLYDVVTTLSVGGEPMHDYRTRIGLRRCELHRGWILSQRPPSPPLRPQSPRDLSLCRLCYASARHAPRR